MDASVWTFCFLKVESDWSRIFKTSTDIWGFKNLIQTNQTFVMCSYSAQISWLFVSSPTLTKCLLMNKLITQLKVASPISSHFHLLAVINANTSRSVNSAHWLPENFCLNCQFANISAQYTYRFVSLALFNLSQFNTHTVKQNFKYRLL